MRVILQKKEILIVAALFAVFIAIRSIHFQDHLNFSQEPASHALEAYRLWAEKKFEFVGPGASFVFEGRRIVHSSLGYYFMMLFLVPANFDPVISSYLFMLFAALSLIPLYTGVRLLSNSKCALLTGVIYALAPLYIDYTRFFWNPNFQLTFVPFIILFMGLYKHSKKHLHLGIAAFISGAMLLFHSQFVVVIAVLLLYYLHTTSKKTAVLFVLGAVFGASPLLLFEIKNNFYNAQTMLLFLKHYKEVFGAGGGAPFSLHYILSPSIFIMLAILLRIKKILNYKHIAVISSLLFIVALFKYAIPPQHAYGTTKDWRYADEVKIHRIVVQQNLANFNIANLAYDTVAVVQKYLLKIYGVSGNFDDYYRNKYLFVVAENPHFSQNTQSYEITTFTPSTIIKNWNINNTYNLYLLKRDTPELESK